MGGGTGCYDRSGCRAGGLSPRGRGNRWCGPPHDDATRSIPAWAGEPAGGTIWGIVQQVYPRVGGGTSRWGSSIHRTEGLSPRGRGNRERTRVLTEQVGSIPAWAGEPRSAEASASPEPVYPRVGGGTGRLTRAGPCGLGLSPRGRGNRAVRRSGSAVYGSIPAWAGEPTPHGAALPRAAVYPRVGGGTGCGTAPMTGSTGLSPRGRGNLLSPLNLPPHERSIPAWAGEPPWPRSPHPHPTVYPRVGGGTSPGPPPHSHTAGLSPRGRGNHLQAHRPGNGVRSIPAWAGEPLEEIMSARRTYARGEYC